ncbi:unknown similar to AMEV053 [Choristoneura rosaceana entomopoxvirus 'L']|uniref:Uncharacterized protein n=1 Tax=Choristoneura rosaceana entomopoxvirus 'L' TaxID=1293539 RepID=A0ABM9QKA5_9POXV|nr:unknown similar to AMEV053 [Choristoneura rosaceana entomopoxvirus 'L']CCU55974.1 unknown similar to AMEV053 [Choristoneura rosaceana entomopoxvirus 'L']
MESNNKSISDKIKTEKPKNDPIYIDNSKTLDIYNKIINNNLLNSSDLVIPDRYDALKEQLIKYDNTINIFNNTFLTISRIKMYDISINNDALVNYSNSLMTYADKLFNDNDFIKNITNLNCDFECDIDDNFYYKYDNFCFIIPDKSSEHITSVVCDKFKLVIEPILNKYFRTLNELILYMYLLYTNKDVVKIDKFKLKCKNNFNSPKLIYSVVEKNESGQNVIKFGDRRDRTRLKKSNIEKPKEKPTVDLSKLDTEKNWKTIDDDGENKLKKNPKKKNDKVKKNTKKHNESSESETEPIHSNKSKSHELNADDSDSD